MVGFEFIRFPSLALFNIIQLLVFRNGLPFFRICPKETTATQHANMAIAINVHIMIHL